MTKKLECKIINNQFHFKLNGRFEGGEEKVIILKKYSMARVKQKMQMKVVKLEYLEKIFGENIEKLLMITL